ncbi:MAG TPA: hypothetical protein VM098_07625 [Phycisphaerae bacterium]|nr:hypothetical protein [Phycisphaerae bacterium]
MALGADIGDFTEIAILVALVLISAVAGLIQRAAKKQEEKRAEEARRHRGTGQARPQQAERPPTARREPQPGMDELFSAAGIALGIEQESAPGVVVPPPPRAKMRQRRQQPVHDEEAVHMLVGKPPRPLTERAGARQAPSGQGEAAQVMPAGIGLGLRNIEVARRAIIYREIFLPPKALRHDIETWEI